MIEHTQLKEKKVDTHVHSEYSNLRMLDCTNKITQLIDRAVELGDCGMAITDHESISGHVKLVQYVKKGKEKGTIPQDFKLMLGNEIYLIDEICERPEGGKYCLTPFYHFILIAKDEIGHRQLRELSSNAWERSFFNGKIERVPTLKEDLSRVVKDKPGHLIATTACIGGELGKTILQINRGCELDLPFDVDDPVFINEEKEHLEQFIKWCVDLFGEDLYFEMQPSEGEEQNIVNQKIIELSNLYGVKPIVATDVHYLRKEDRAVHEAYLNSREDKERELADFYATTYMMSPEEIHEYMDKYIGQDLVSEALANTLEIGDKVEEYDLYCPTIVPAAEIPEFEVEHLFSGYYDRCEYIKKFAYSDNVYDRYLLKLIEDGFYEKIPFKTFSKEKFFEYIDRIEIELKEMWLVTLEINTSISSYYLTTRELIEIMWNEGDSLVGVARGSVTGMETMYLIGITQLDPIPWKLPHWRHISHEKADLSDVDIDTQQNRRAQIIEAVKQKRGERKVLNCSTFKTEGSKSAILTAGRGLGIEADITSYLANLIPITRGFTWTLNDCVYGNEEEERKPVQEFINECRNHPGLLDTAMSIEGLVSGRSIHASAVYLFNEDYLEHNAMMKAPNGVHITQFNMKDSDYCSGLKMDFLTIQSLDRIRFCMEMLIENGYMEWQGSLRDTYNKYLHPDVLDYETQEMWDMMSNNEVFDLFQFNTQVGLQAAQQMKPHSLVEMAAANSIMRLMVSEKGAEQPIDTYIRYKNNIEEWYSCMRDEYHLTEEEIKIVEPYLLPSYGVGATQEDVMQLSMDKHIANFNVALSNKLRKGIAKKDKQLQADMKKMFFEHGEKINTSKNLLNYIWKEVVGKQLGLNEGSSKTQETHAKVVSQI